MVALEALRFWNIMIDAPVSLVPVSLGLLLVALHTDGLRHPVFGAPITTLVIVAVRNLLVLLRRGIRRLARVPGTTPHKDESNSRREHRERSSMFCHLHHHLLLT